GHLAVDVWGERPYNHAMHTDSAITFRIVSEIIGAEPVMAIVRKHESMSFSVLKKGFFVGAIFCVALAFLIGRFTSFEPRWRGLRDGMTRSEVAQALGRPSWIGTSGYIGAGGKQVIRWDYRRSYPGRCIHYYVDFDYIGIAGTAVVYRTERYAEDWDPFWLPWRAKARA